MGGAYLTNVNVLIITSIIYIGVCPLLQLLHIASLHFLFFEVFDTFTVRVVSFHRVYV